MSTGIEFCVRSTSFTTGRLKHVYQESLSVFLLQVCNTVTVCSNFPITEIETQNA